MNLEEIKEYIKAYNVEKGYGDSDADLLESLMEENRVSRKETSGSRWWNNYDYVVKIKDKFFEFEMAETTGDMSAREAGWEFDWNSVREVFPVEETKIVYK